MTMESDEIDNQDINLVAYCGLYCPKCYRMSISETAALLKKGLENPHVCGKMNFLSESFLTDLNNLIAVRCTKICRDGGGNPKCQIRKCCVQMSLEGCWKCTNLETCAKLKEQYVRNIKKIKELGLGGYIGERCKL